MSSKFAQVLIKENMKKMNFTKNKKICENCPKKIKKINWTTNKKERLNIKTTWISNNN